MRGLRLDGGWRLRNSDFGIKNELGRFYTTEKKTRIANFGIRGKISDFYTKDIHDDGE